MSQITTMNSETKVLITALDDQRRHILTSLDGLSDGDLRRPVLPSGWSCLGLIQHLTNDIERFWFRAVSAGEEIPLIATPDEAWRVAADDPAESVTAAYRQETARKHDHCGHVA